jgi:alkanesulfonate monooxygenase SsuD/methylene tetrahydromethanopterin reductase-like flavin-dependent oxidoreductase (luciferase family)
MLCDGRFVLGVGVGEHQIEYRLAGKEFTRRGRALDDGIAQLRSLWSTGAIDDDDPGPAWFRQRPTPPSIPIWLGGRSQPAIDRTARMGDGWMPIFVTPEQFATATSRLDRALDDAGRDRSDVLRAVTIIAAITDGPSGDRAALEWCGELWNMPSEPLRTYLVSGPVEVIAESMDAYRAAGADHISLLLATDDPIAMYQRIVESSAHR